MEESVHPNAEITAHLKVRRRLAPDSVFVNSLDVPGTLFTAAALPGPQLSFTSHCAERAEKPSVGITIFRILGSSIVRDRRVVRC